MGRQAAVVWRAYGREGQWPTFWVAARQSDRKGLVPMRGDSLIIGDGRLIGVLSGGDREAHEYRVAFDGADDVDLEVAIGDVCAKGAILFPLRGLEVGSNFGGSRDVLEVEI